MLWVVLIGVAAAVLVFVGVYGCMANRKILAASCFGLLAGILAAAAALFFTEVMEMLQFFF